MGADAWVLGYDGFDDVEALTPAGLSTFTAGLDAYLRDAVAATAPLNRGYRNYLGLGSAGWSATSTQGKTLEALGPVSLVCTWAVGTGGADSYSDATLAAIAAGTHDAAFATMVRQLPIGSNRPAGKRYRFYRALNHEQDNYGPAVDRAVYRAAIQRFCKVAARTAIEMGADPDELGVGGLLLTGGMADQSWWWWDGITSALTSTEMRYVVGLWDTYFRFTSDGAGGYKPEPFRAKVDPHITAMLSGGITRFVLAETALAWDTRANPDVMVGDAAGAVAWLGTVDTAVNEIPGLEGVSFFTKPTGEASKHGSFTRPGSNTLPMTVPPSANPVAVAFAAMCAKRNRRTTTVTAPVITNHTLSPTMPTGGYVTGTVVRVTVTYSDPDSKPAVPAVPAVTVTGTLTVQDRSGDVATAQIPFTWAAKPEVPAYVDVADVTLTIPGIAPSAIRRVSMTGAQAVFEFTAP
jgi:hypothetical protein